MKRGKTSWLTKERIRMLDEIEFDWTPTVKREKDDSDEKEEA